MGQRNVHRRAVPIAIDAPMAAIGRIVAFSEDGGCLTEVDEEKVDDMVLALLYLTTFEDKPRLRAWRGPNWNALDRFIGGITSRTSNESKIGLID